MLRTLNGGLRPWQAPAGSAWIAQVHALWCGTAVQPLTDRAAKLALMRELANGMAVPGSKITLAAAAVLVDDPRQAVRLRDQAGPSRSC